MQQADAEDESHATAQRPAGAAGAPIDDGGARPSSSSSLNEQLLAWPRGFKPHPTTRASTLRAPRARRSATAARIDWGHAEALAFASLLTEGIERAPHRPGRGARHVLAPPRGAARREDRRDVHAARAPAEARGAFEIYNSPLSETAVLGFEYGFSDRGAATTLVLWEAQFGDFVNVAQPIIDQFIVADRAKWGQDSGSCCCCRTATRGRARSTRARASSGSCSCAPRAT